MLKFFLKKIFLPGLLIILSAAAIYGSFFIWKVTLTGEKINSDSQAPASFFNTIRSLAPKKEIKLAGYDKGRINILILGISGQEKGGTNLSDTIMVASINTVTNQVALLSIPRDLHVEIPDSSIATKINSLYQHGLNAYPDDQNKAVQGIIKAAENITSLPINYWIVLDFAGFVQIIDSIGGINITNEKDIYDPRYPGPNYSYTTFELPKGLHHLDGETALKYARMRHNDLEGDFGRAKRQQQVIQAAKNKIFSAGTFLNVSAVNRMLDALGDNLHTNIKISELGNFIELMKTADTNNINNAVVDAWNKDSLLIVTHIASGDMQAFALIPRIGNWSEIHELSQNIFDMNNIKKRREEISQENARVAIMNKSGSAIVASRLKNLLQENFGYKNVITITAPGRLLAEGTIAYDLSNGQKPYTLDELAKKLPAEISQKLPAPEKNALGNIALDIMIVAGKDIVQKFGMEKGSFEEYNNYNQ